MYKKICFADDVAAMKAERSGEISRFTKSETELSSVAVNGLCAKIREDPIVVWPSSNFFRTTNPGARVHQANSDTAALSESIIDLVTQSANPSGKPPPIAIVGSNVSVASTSSHPGNGGNAPAFSRLS